MAHPDFMIIGAMKSGTSTLQAQLKAQPRVFMTDPKEPNFFSDDDVFAKGKEWYEALFSEAHHEDLTGEASTHYTKLPTYPHVIKRMRDFGLSPKLIYVVRNPIDRAISHYMHEWTMNVITAQIEDAFDERSELIDYSRYAYQIEPFLEAFGHENIHVTSLEALKRQPEKVLAETADFVGLTGPIAWQTDLQRMNVSSERIRRFPLHGLLIENPVAAGLRRILVPQFLRDRIKHSRQIDTRPDISDGLRQKLETIFKNDFEQLQKLIGENSDVMLSYSFLENKSA